ncbi:hypothetical protein PW52_02355 [Tamlana sedimentorum]|uniref:Uncharacterized protein n=1 Tax=Neotamlana sedimentorum TaxID=1435349 RepID=A0A0D7WHS7_9FLAO|nr:DUF4998 domain-containing protein [Tamlana sedimentorum]KJD37277.1 hypothetical protein PW52_02355 [Tamlana sedimentorum]
MINNIKNKLINPFTFGVVCVLLAFSCDTELTETFDEFIPENVVSLGKPDSVAVVPTGVNKVVFEVFVNSDPKIKKAVIALFDDDVTDDDDKIVATIDIDRTVFAPETYMVETQLPEGGSEYFIHMEDEYGNKSIKYDVFGTVLGDSYVETLEARSYVDVRLYSETEAIITWDSNRTTNDDDEEIVVNPLLVKSVITYTSSVDGSGLTVEVDESEDLTIIPDFISEGTFTYTTFYKVSEDSEYTFESNPTEGTFPAKI